MPSISVAMATYNGERYLEQQLNSIAAQTCRPRELIVSDDYSTDRTIGIVERFASSVDFEVIVRRNGSRVGYSKNFERALAACSGDIVFLCDQDDVWNANKIETVCKVFDEERRLMCVVSDMALVDASLNSLNVTQLDLIVRLGGTERDFVAGCGTALRREWRDYVLPFPDNIPFDSWISALAVRLEVRRALPEVLQLYRRHGENTTNSVFVSWKGRRSLIHPDFSRWMKGKAPHNFEAQAKELDAYEARLSRARVETNLDVDPAVVNQAIASVQKEKVLVRKRSEYVALPRATRVIPVLSSLVNGDYSAASGILSAAKDLIARQSGDRDHEINPN